METKPPENNKKPLEKSKKEQEFIDVFSYFEEANIRNREAFAELLEYTIKNRSPLNKVNHVLRNSSNNK